MRAAVLVLVAGCGRLGFDPAHLGDATGATDTIDAFDPSLIAWYPMDDLAAGSVADASGNGHTGSCNAASSACPVVGAGRHGNAYVFDGVNDQITIPASAAFETTSALTISLWLRLDTVPANTGCAVNKLFGTGTGDSWQICINSVRTLYFWTDALSLVAISIVPVGTWHHVADTWDGTTKTMWFDGVNVGTQSAGMTFDGSGLTLGEDNDNGAPFAPLGAGLDDVRMYNRVLSDAEIQALATAP